MATVTRYGATDTHLYRVVARPFRMRDAIAINDAHLAIHERRKAGDLTTAQHAAYSNVPLLQHGATWYALDLRETDIDLADANALRASDAFVEVEFDESVFESLTEEFVIEAIEAINECNPQRRLEHEMLKKTLEAYRQQSDAASSSLTPMPPKDEPDSEGA